MKSNFSWIFGVAIGFGGGCLVRDNYIFSYGKKIDIIHEDYNKMR